MRLKELLDDLVNREVEEVSVFGRHNNWVATCSLSTLREASTNRYLEEMDSEVFDFFGITYVKIDDEEEYIDKEITEVMEIEGR